MLGKRVDWRAAYLDALFANAPCAECGHGATQHEAINVSGQPFARCLMVASRSEVEANERAWRTGRRQ